MLYEVEGAVMHLVPLRRRIRKAGRRLREARMLVRAFKSQYQPVAAHLIPTRRCNLSCGYCNEYDDHSSPIPTQTVFRRIDRLAALGTGIVTLSGGEPLLHPDLEAIISRIREGGMIATLITNGYLLTRDRIAGLNRAGLDYLQISIDNVVPDEVSKKSLKTLDQKLRWLAEDGEFDVAVNAVVGGRIRNPEDAAIITRRARGLGFSATVGIIHDGSGQLLPLVERQRLVLAEVVTAGESLFDFANYNRFQKNLANGRPNSWHCGAGCRYLYVCEDGLVHWCSQQRGHPGIPLEQYGCDDLRREYHRIKECAPLCTIGCVHRVAQVDELRQNPQRALTQWFSSADGETPPSLPVPVRILMWAFVTNPHRDLFRHLAAHVFGADRRVQP
jgi:MoaA/NifB/PqqE/SkfB family radical SAM enzyme